jgi:hypothetical protein
MRHLGYSVRYALVPINSSLLTIKLYYSVRATLVDDTKYSVPFMTLYHIKVKHSRYRPELVLRVDRGIALPFRDLGARMGWVVSTTPRPLYPRERPGTHCDVIPEFDSIYFLPRNDHDCLDSLTSVNISSTQLSTT